MENRLMPPCQSLAASPGRGSGLRDVSADLGRRTGDDVRRRHGRAGLADDLRLQLFLYPWQTWIAGPWDLFIEHGHRLLGALVGLLTIALVVVVWLQERSTAGCAWRRWRPWRLVIVQGVLGGMRVLLDERTLAMIHGCVGPLFFAYCVLLASFTSRWWRERADGRSIRQAARFARLALATVGLGLRATGPRRQLRHVDRSADAAAVSHAGRVPSDRGRRAWHSRMLLVGADRGRCADRRLSGWPAAALGWRWSSLQIVLGARHVGGQLRLARLVRRLSLGAGHMSTPARACRRCCITTAHVAIGSLILAIAA